MDSTRRANGLGPRRVRARAALFALTGLLALSCAERDAFDAPTYLRGQIEAQSDRQTADGVSFPFELDTEALEDLRAKLKPVGDTRRRASRILDFIFRGLDLQYEQAPTRDASETFRRRRGNCLSFVNLFVAAGRQVRINPFYVEVEDYQRWDHRQGMVVSRGHIVAGLYIDGELRTYDFLPYQVKSYKSFQPIDDLTATAHFYNNLGAEALLAGDMETSRRHLDTAVAVDPTFVKATNNLGVWHARHGNLDAAVDTYLQGLEIVPEDVPLWINLARAYQRLGRTDEAAEALARVDDTHHANPFFFVYQGEVALARGDVDEALRHMRDALRTDTEAPEVHIGLTRVYVALGELEKARHHLERALDLDPGHPEARELRHMLTPALDASTPDESASEPDGQETES